MDRMTATTVRPAIEQLEEDAAVVRELHARRNDLIRQAREDGKTWREIAAALDMTETAVMSAAKR